MTNLDRRPRAVGDEVMNGDWVASLLATRPIDWVTSAINLVSVLEGGTPGPATKARGSAKWRPFAYDAPRRGLNGLQYDAMMCNTDTSGTSFADMWGALQARRTADPGLGGLYFTAWCADWPLHAPPTHVVRGHSPLQLSGHKDEDVTPYRWVQEAQKATGGALLTVQDDVHASLAQLPCVSKVLAFFRSGNTTNGTCPGDR
ncbi:alpha/beta hydrolase [Streptomyces mirabilis]|uniref:alpha/beta hydrolase n=1 Tax=Streptomyces mirabilis TaxID=68239 RepID=UPI00225255A4|nr:alpha/beta hydrolase [Streptomyces mirabilis]MCX4428761.1 alpha/beta hydrolase [Streptomyces mirabilis]